MNERITELYVQANKYASDTGFKKYDKAGDVNWQWEDTVFEKFAELIVKECAGLVDNKIEVSRYVHEAELLRECSTTIKLHFGVEE